MKLMKLGQTLFDSQTNEIGKLLIITLQYGKVDSSEKRKPSCIFAENDLAHFC